MYHFICCCTTAVHPLWRRHRAPFTIGLANCSSAKREEHERKTAEALAASKKAEEEPYMSEDPEESEEEEEESPGKKKKAEEEPRIEERTARGHAKELEIFIGWLAERDLVVTAAEFASWPAKLVGRGPGILMATRLRPRGK